MYILASEFLGEDNKYASFLNKSDDYKFLYIRNLKNLRLKPFFSTQYSFIFVWAGREYLMDIVQ